MIDKSVIILAILGYLGIMFKTTLSGILSYILLYIKATIVVDSNDGILYENVVTLVSEMRNSAVKNNIKATYRWSEAKGEFIIYCMPDLSSYIIKNSRFNWTLVHVNKEILMDRELFRIRLIFFGTHFKENYEKFKNELLNIEPEKKISIVEQNTFTSLNIRERNFDKLFIENKEFILRKIDKWVQSKDFYKQNEIPYKMGILLSGKPGTGKTSFILALANHLNYNIKVLGSDIVNRGDFLTGEPNTICVIEDVDRILELSSTNVRGSSVHSILQLLDGVHNPDNSVFILTTNHKEKLDPSLYRPGRIYLDLELNDISEELALDMVRSFSASKDILNEESFPINPAYLQNKILLSFENSVS